MKKEFFTAQCPLEIGDKVAIKLIKETQTKGQPLDALYLPPNATILIGGAEIRIATVTDIATIHYLKSGETQFIYELDNGGAYKPMNVTMPVEIYNEALKQRDITKKQQESNDIPVFRFDRNRK